MKNTIILFLVMTAYLYSQGWNNIKTTSVNESNLVKMDLFTNKDGNHLLIQTSNATNPLKYYLLDSKGSIIRNNTVETSGGATFPNITGTDNEIYLVYKLGNNLIYKKSTNQGSSWGDPVEESVSSNICNGVDIAYDDAGLHVVYATQDNGSEYETYYHLITGDIWGSEELVTPDGSVGGFPTISVSDDHVYVSYNTGDDDPDEPGNQGAARIVTKHGVNWQSFQIVLNSNSGAENLIFRNDSLFTFIFNYEAGQNHYDLLIKRRSPDGNSFQWYTLPNFNFDNLKIESSGETAVTNNNLLHFIYDDNPNIMHQSYRTDGYHSTAFQITSDVLQTNSNLGLSFYTNDLYTIWKSSQSNYLKVRHYDLEPLPPTNFSGTNENGHPRLNWTLSTDPDVGFYEIYWKVDPLEGSGTDWALLTTVNQGICTFLDQGVELNGTRLGKVLYKVRSKEFATDGYDIYQNLSVFTSQVLFNYSGLNKISIGNGPGSFELSSNYPNPFNPSTTNSFSIPERSFVTLKVYDMLGREVAELVNKELETGSFEKTFDARSFASGVYIYRITAMKDGKILFNESRPMLLIK